ncbi:hypothetical protein EI555_008426 [Monodon monoceros]|uniref:ACB domain-containing protein n=1 Tax=Monodon monoceros TaxID=40151 RepID=A0A4U1FIC6_MONMO|nr:hypothetical protein EI555_008426 [Monodon monoceros]
MVKKEAWKALGDSSPSRAMQEYIAVVKKLDPSWNPQSPEKKGKEANTGFGGPVVSSLYHEEIIRTMKVKQLYIMILVLPLFCDLNMVPAEEYISKERSKGNQSVLVPEEIAYSARNPGEDEVRELENSAKTQLCYPRHIRPAACEFLDIVELLLQSGADPTVRDQDGCLPEEATGCRAVTLMLQQHTTGKV